MSLVENRVGEAYPRLARIVKIIGMIGRRHTFGAHLAQNDVDMVVIRDLRGHQRRADRKVLRASGAESSFVSAVQRLNKKENLLPKTDLHRFPALKTTYVEVPLTDSFEGCYVPEVALLAGVAKLAYAADSKTSANHDSTSYKTYRNLPKISFKPRTGADFSPIVLSEKGESY